MAAWAVSLTPERTRPPADPATSREYRRSRLDRWVTGMGDTATEVRPGLGAAR